MGFYIFISLVLVNLYLFFAQLRFTYRPGFLLRSYRAEPRGFKSFPSVLWMELRNIRSGVRNNYAR